jgi:hypothetical protein
MLAGSVLWGLFLPHHNDPFLYLCFIWLPSTWLVFPLGALLGGVIPRWVAKRGLVAAVSIGLAVGAVAGLALATGFWLWTNHHDLIGLVTNRRSGGYASYSDSVRHHLREQAWWVLSVVPPITTVWVASWTVLSNRFLRRFPPLQTHETSSPTIFLRLDHHLFRIVSWMAAGLGVFATAVLLATSLAGRGVHVPLTSFLLPRRFQWNGSSPTKPSSRFHLIKSPVFTADRPNLLQINHVRWSYYSTENVEEPLFS